MRGRSRIAGATCALLVFAQGCSSDEASGWQPDAGAAGECNVQRNVGAGDASCDTGQWGDVGCKGATLEWPCNAHHPEFGFRCCSK